MKLSIIIPTLNEEDYLPLLLESIKKQNFNGDYEIIVADANSKDRTIEIAKKYGCKITKGGLPAKGKNEGAKIAKGDLLLFLDADTISLLPKFLDTILEKFRARDLDIVSFSLSPKENKFDKFAYSLYNFWARFTQGFLPHAAQAILIKKEVHQIIGGFDEEIKIAEDHFYVRTAAKFAKFRFINLPLLVSSRRFERDGRFKTYLKYLLVGLHLFFLGPVKSDIFRYRFGYYSKNQKPSFRRKRRWKRRRSLL